MTGQEASAGAGARQYHHGDLRTAMIRAAEQLVTELGPEGVSVREVARRAGVSSGAPFHHFPTRKALMTAVAEEATIQLLRAVTAAIETIPSGQPRELLLAVGRAYLRWVIDNPARFRVVSDRRLIEYSESIRADNAAMQTMLRDILRRHDGEAPALDTTEMILGLRGMAYGLARMFVDGHLPQWGVLEQDPAPRLEKVLESYVDLLIRGEG